MTDDYLAISVRPRLLIRLDANFYPNRQDYLLRLADSNCFDGINALCRVLGVGFAKMVTASNEGINNYLRGYPELKGLGSQKGLSLLQRARGRKRRICPACVLEDLPHAACLNFALPIICPRHNIVPHDVCQACDKPIDYLASSIHRCSCGFFFGDSARIVPAGWFTEFQEVFSPQVAEGRSYDELAKSFVYLAHFAAYLTNYEPDTFGGRHVSTAWLSQKEFHRVSSFMINWVDRIKDRAAYHQHHMGPRGRAYWKNVLKHIKAPLLYNAFSRTSTKSKIPPNRLLRSERGMVEVLPQNMIPLQATFKMLGGGRGYFINQFVSEFEKDIIYFSRKRWIKVELAVPFLELIDSTVSLEEAKCISGASISQIRSFIRLKILKGYKLLPSMKNTRRVSKEELHNLISRVVKQSQDMRVADGPMVALSAIVPVRDESEWQPIARAWDRFFKAVFDGKVPTFLRRRNVNLTEVYILEKDLRTYRVPQYLSPIV
ncbi:hypothetical protein [Pseudoduganella sp. RAF53_2]|uniref:hypothetical protein n=1 Tax=unclassified Pseudoduganella TaxID=2637179 RepID=UPI003F9C252C